MFARQPAEHSAGLDAAALVAIGRDPGISDPRFPDCVRSGLYRDWVRSVTESAYAHDVAVTPAILVDGRRLDTASGQVTTTLAAAITQR
jgi:hypothetical protein